MSYEIVVQLEPAIEMRKAFEWYEYKQDGKGYEMIERNRSSLRETFQASSPLFIHPPEK